MKDKVLSSAAMARTESAQLNVRSRFARDRAAAIALETGMTTTQVVEEALRTYVPPPPDPVPAGLIRKGALLVMPAHGRQMTLEEANAALDDARLERDEAIR